MATITSIDKPRCIHCKRFRPIGELNGYDPLAPIGQRYKAAYCRNLLYCESNEMKSLVKYVNDQLNPETD